MIKHLIFDLDGTLADTLPSIVLAANITLKHYKKNYKVTIKEGKEYIGYGTPYLIKKCFHDENRNDYDEVIKYYVSKQKITHKAHAKRFPNLITSLKSLKKKGYKLYIATNKPHEVAVQVINSLYGKNFFIDLVDQKNNTPKKPDPYVINQVIKRNNLKREECIYIGDHECDIKTANNANIPCIVVNYGYGNYEDKIFKKAKKVINSPKEIIKYLK